MTRRRIFTDEGTALRSGFTLLEMVVSIGIFSVLITITIGAVIAINKAQLKASNIQTVVDNIRFSLESMTKEMRTATDFQPRVPLAHPQAYAELYFTRSDGTISGYCVEANALKKVTGAPVCAGSAVTSEDIVVENITFFVIGQDAGPTDGQPRITIFLTARSSDTRLETNFHLQTTITPRIRDF